MTINCPKCGRKLLVESRLFGHLVRCPFCKERFAVPTPPRKARPSGWHDFLSGLFVPFGAVAKFARKFWHELWSLQKRWQASKHTTRSSISFSPRSHSVDLDISKEDEELYYYDQDEDKDDGQYEDDADESASRERTYYDSSGTYAGYRDEEGWFHGEGGHNYMGYMEDDGSFYDGSGAYRGQVEDGGLVWEEGNGYTGFHEDGHFSEEGHYGVPDIYEDGGNGTGGAFDSLMADDDDDGDR